VYSGPNVGFCHTPSAAIKRGPIWRNMGAEKAWLEKRVKSEFFIGI
jgi:hypothetical protein